MPEDNGKQNPEESYTNKYHKDITYSSGYKFVCVNDKFSKLFKTYLGEGAVYNFINSIIEESKYCSDVMKKHFNKELLMTCDDLRILRTQLNVGSLLMIMLIMMLK